MNDFMNRNEWTVRELLLNELKIEIIFVQRDIEQTQT